MKKVLIILMALICNHSFAQFKPRTYPPASLILERLNTYHTDFIKRIDFAYFNAKINVNDSVRNKLLSLIKNEWTDSDVKAKTDHYMLEKPFKDVFEYRFWYNGIKDTITAIAQTRRRSFDSVYHLIYDSMAIAYRKDVDAQIRNSEVPDELVRCAAAAGIKEAIPLLRNDLNATTHRYKPAMAKLALAAFGDTAYQRVFFDRHRQYIAQWDITSLFIDFNNLSLIGTQQSVYLLQDWIDTSKKASLYPDGPVVLVYQSGKILNPLLWLIGNADLRTGLLKLPQQEWFKTDPDNYATAEQLLFVKQWMVNHRGQYKF